MLNPVQKYHAILQEWFNSQGTPNQLPLADGLAAISKLINLLNLDSLSHFLPFFLTLKGKPFSLGRHFPFEPVFKFRNVPRRSVVLAGRQVGKSQSLAALSVLLSVVNPYLNTLHVTPLFEQIRKFSGNYVRPLLDSAIIKNYFLRGKAGEGNVLQRGLVNGSIIFFTYAATDADRVRGISADRMIFDEYQDADSTLVPIIEETLSASEIGSVALAGTAKTTDNALTYEYQQSSMARWVIPCDCGYWNTCAVDEDLDHMVQEKGFCCRKCGRVVNPSKGHYRHMAASKVGICHGIHIPQPIMPMHYGNPMKWRDIWLKKTTKPKHIYYNECLGEPNDVGTKLITRNDIKRISVLPWENKYAEAIKQVPNYHTIMMGVDWGGGAGGTVVRKRNSIVVQGGSNSFTVVTVVGFNHSPKGHVLYAERFRTDMKEHQEAARVLQLYRDFRCTFLGHDAGGAGKVRESILVTSGMPIKAIAPYMYTGISTKNICTYVAPNTNFSRHYYSLDKARSVGILCSIIKAEEIAFPKWKEYDDPTMCIFEDFLSLIEDKYETSNAGDNYRILYNPRMPNDFVHALNFACTCFWHSNQQYPNLASKYGIRYNTAHEDHFTEEDEN